MSGRMIKSLFALLLCSRTLVGQQSANTTSIVERLAVQAALERAHLTSQNLRIVIDPMIAYANVAPGYRDSTLRDAERNTYLTKSFRARSGQRKDVIACRAHACTLRDADVLVTLSQPMINGPNAQATVTTLQRTGRGTAYTTVNVHLERRSADWKVVSFDDLGMS
jgi:hypothetical protein